MLKPNQISIETPKIPASQIETRTPEEINRERFGTLISSLERINIVGLEAFQAFSSAQRPKEGNGQFWFKLGQDNFYNCALLSDGQIIATRSYGNGANRKNGKTIGFGELCRLSKTQDGGVFYLPDQPLGAPLKDFVAESDDLRAEFDEGTQDQQWEKIEAIAACGLVPTFTLTSGGKSLHAHWKLDQFLPVAQVQNLNRIIAILLLSDPAVTHVPQPMRAPGFFRKEKGNEQALIQFSEQRYSYDEAIAALRRYANSIGVPFPAGMCDEWWSGAKFFRLTKEHNHSADSELIKALEVGYEGWKAQNEQKRLEAQKRRVAAEIKRKERGLTGKTLIEAINEAEERLSTPSFYNHPSHNWKGTDSHSRGCCPFHHSTSGNSAWTNDQTGKTAYHCATCTDSKPVYAFGYWLMDRHGIKDVPKGKQWVELAKDFLTSNGFEVPDDGWRPSRQLKKQKQGETTILSREQVATKNWVPFLSAQGDGRQYFGTGIANDIEAVLSSDSRGLYAQAGTPGTGKSTSAAAVAKVAKRQGQSLIAITPQETSAKGLSLPSALGVPYRKDNFRGSDSFSACTNALIPNALNANWSGQTEGNEGVLLLDEASESNQLLSGLKSAERVKRNTAQGLLSTRQVVVAQSATLKQYDIDFYKHLGGFKGSEVHLDAIASAPWPRNIEIYHQSRMIEEGAHESKYEGDLDPKPQLLYEAIEAAKTAQTDGTAVVITSNSQKPNSRWGTMFLDKVLKTEVPGENITRVDSQTTKDSEHPAKVLIESGDVSLLPGEVFVLSPSAETNISFHGGAGVKKILWITLDTGNKTVERLIQDCRARGKEGVEIIQKIAISDYIGKLPHGDAFTPDAVLKDIKLQISNGGAKRFHKLLGGQALDENDPIVQDYCKREADKSCSLIGKALILPKVLKDQGHIVSSEEVCEYSDLVEDFNKRLDQYREKAIAQWNDTIANAEIIEKSTVESLERRGYYSISEWFAIQRFKVENLLGNRLTEKVQDGAIVSCNEGIALTPALVDVVDRQRQVKRWRRSFDLIQTPFDWFVKSIRKLDGETPSALESANSTFAQFVELEELGILAFVREQALMDAFPDWNYESFLTAKKPSAAFQAAMVKEFKDKAFTTKDPRLVAIAQKLSEKGVLERVCALLGIRNVEKDQAGAVTPGNVLTIIRRFFEVRTFRSKSARINGFSGATILSFDDRSHRVYSDLLVLDDLKPATRLEEVATRETLLSVDQSSPIRSNMFPIWEEQRKVSVVRASESVPLLQQLEDISLCNKGTDPCNSIPNWLEKGGVRLDKALEPEPEPAPTIGARVTRISAQGWSGIVKAIKDGIAHVLYFGDTEPTRTPLNDLVNA